MGLGNGTNVFVGTCSWADRSLIECGRFYPSGAKSAEGRLRFYASQFPVVEVDSTYYALPPKRNSILWNERTPDGFRFHIKAYSLFTQHPARVDALPRDIREALQPGIAEQQRVYLRDVPAALVTELWDRFRDAIEPLDAGGKMGLVLLQFPRWVFPSRDTFDYILECGRRLEPHRAAVESRNSVWLNERNRDRSLKFLEENGMAFVCVDEPQGFTSSAPPVAQVTAEVAYVRFHGRNNETWEKSGASASDRFDHYYTDAELMEWVPRIRHLQEEASEVHVLFNTNRDDQGPANARNLVRLLE